MGTMKCLVCTNAVAEASVEVHDFAKRDVGDKSMSFIH